MKQMTKEEAIEFAKSKKWEALSYRERAALQLIQDRLCMPFDVFHEAVEKALGRPVWTHEFVFNKDGLEKEFLGLQRKPTFDEIVSLIPEEKRILIRI